jgi:hypothetical protein
VSPILISFLFLVTFTLVFAIAGYRFFNIYWEKLWFVILLIPLAAVPLYYQINHLYDRFWPGVWGQSIWISFCYLNAALYGDMRKASVLKLQNARDQESATLSASLGAAPGTGQNFALYLRPFTVTKNIPTSLPGTHYTDSEFDGVLDFEAILQDAVQAIMPLVALGRPLETYGAGRILTGDEDWQSKIIPLMQAARIIFIIPSHRPGTLWEINHITENRLLEKCIFIMPPEGAVRWTRGPEQDWQYDEPLVNQSGDWETTRQTLEELGLHLPSYEQTGALFTLDGSGRLDQYAELPILLPTFTGAGGYIQAIRSLIAHLEDTTGLFSEYKDERPARTLDLLEQEEVIVDVKPGGFEWTVYPQTSRARIIWFLSAIVFCYLFVSACRNIQYTLLLTAESAVAVILVNIAAKIIAWFREA